MKKILIIAIIIVILGGALYYIFSQRKKGAKCIGCPYCKDCNGHCNGGI